MDPVPLDLPCLTSINTFTIDPARSNSLVDSLDKIVKENMNQFDGFISSEIHASEDKTTVIFYTNWRDRAAFDMMLADDATCVRMKETARLANSVDPVFYELATSLAA